MSRVETLNFLDRIGLAIGKIEFHLGFAVWWLRRDYQQLRDRTVRPASLRARVAPSRIAREPPPGGGERMTNCEGQIAG